jgi:ribosome-binding factor A
VGEEAQQDVMAGLNKATGYLRRELGKRVRLQNTPELRFKWDETLEAAARIDELIRSLHEAEKAQQPEEHDEPD